MNDEEITNQNQASQSEGHRMTEEEARKLAAGALQWADLTWEEMFNANELTDEIVQGLTDDV